MLWPCSSRVIRCLWWLPPLPWDDNFSSDQLVDEVWKRRYYYYYYRNEFSSSFNQQQPRTESMANLFLGEATLEFESSFGSVTLVVPESEYGWDFGNRVLHISPGHPSITVIVGKQTRIHISCSALRFWKCFCTSSSSSAAVAGSSIREPDFLRPSSAVSTSTM